MIGWRAGAMVESERLIPRAAAFEKVVLGRVLVRKEESGEPIGSTMLATEMERCTTTWKTPELSIGETETMT